MSARRKESEPTGAPETQLRRRATVGLDGSLLEQPNAMPGEPGTGTLT